VLLLGLTGHSLPLIEDQPTMVRRWYVTDWTGLNFHCRPCTFPLCLFCTTRGRKSCDPTRPITTARSPLPAPTGSRCCAVLYCTSSATRRRAALYRAPTFGLFSNSSSSSSSSFLFLQRLRGGVFSHPLPPQNIIPQIIILRYYLRVSQKVVTFAFAEPLECRPTSFDPSPFF
jgi:hypothetical protein